MQLLRLNLGCEFNRLLGYTNIDINPHVRPDLIADARELRRYDDCSCSEILASHLLEHFYESEVVPALSEWNRLLAPGGLLTIIVPDVEKVARAWLAGELNEKDILHGFIGSNQQKSPWQLHRTFFWRDRLFRLLSENNFDSLEEFNRQPGLLWLQVSAHRKK